MPWRRPGKSGADRKAAADDGRVEAAVPEGIHGTHGKSGVREIAGITRGCGTGGGESDRQIAGRAGCFGAGGAQQEERIIERPSHRVFSQSKGKTRNRGPKQAEAAGPALDFETCMEQIWEQLISAPPSRGRSMTTVKLGAVRLLMSSWEVAAFVSEDGPAAEDLRRAVVARALLTSNLEHAKETGNATGLDRALTIARVEVSRLQERVEAAKQAKDTEAAVNLGISTKRLLSALDEGEKL